MEPSSGEDLVRPAAPNGEVPPQVLEWARHQFTDEEIAAGIREIHESGGLTMDDILGDLDRPTEAHD